MSFHDEEGGGGHLIRWFYHRVITEQETICPKLPFNISFSTERLTLEICMYKTAFMPHMSPTEEQT